MSSDPAPIPDDAAQIVKKWTERGLFGRTKHRMLLRKRDGTLIYYKAWSDEYHLHRVGEWVQHEGFSDA